MSGKAKIKPAVRLQVIERDGVYCRYCGYGPMRVAWGVASRTAYARLYTSWTEPGDLGSILNLDHRDCEADGGATDPANLVVSCSRCNQRKWTKDADELLPASPLCFLPAPSVVEIEQRRLVVA